MIGIDIFTLEQFYKWLWGNEYTKTLIDCKNVIVDNSNKIVYTFDDKKYDRIQVYPVA